MISDHFDERQLKQLLTIADAALADGDTFDRMAKELKLGDVGMTELRDELNLFIELESDRIDEDEDADADADEDSEDSYFARTFAAD